MSDIIATSADGRFRAVIDFDDYAENPRTWADVITGAVTFPDRQFHDVPESGPLADQWRRLIDRHEYHSRGARADVGAIFERYVRACHGGVSEIFSPHDGPSAIFYVLPDMMRAAGFSDEESTSVQRMTDVLQAELSEYRSYADGDVYVIRVDELQTWQRVGHEDETRDVWDTVESLGQVIGDSYAREEAMMMLASAVGVTVRPAAGDFLQSAETTVVCPGCDQRITVTRDGSECGGQGDGGCDVANGDTPDHTAHERADIAHKLAIAEAAPFLD